MLGLGDFVLDCSEGLHAGNQNDPSHLLHFWSNHQGGAHFLIVTWSVRYLSISNNHPTFLALGSRSHSATGDCRRWKNATTISESRKPPSTAASLKRST